MNNQQSIYYKAMIGIMSTFKSMINFYLQATKIIACFFVLVRLNIRNIHIINMWKYMRLGQTLLGIEKIIECEVMGLIIWKDEGNRQNIRRCVFVSVGFYPFHKSSKANSLESLYCFSFGLHYFIFCLFSFHLLLNSGAAQQLNNK